MFDSRLLAQALADEFKHLTSWQLSVLSSQARTSFFFQPNQSSLLLQQSLPVLL